MLHTAVLYLSLEQGGILGLHTDVNFMLLTLTSMAFSSWATAQLLSRLHGLEKKSSLVLPDASNWRKSATAAMKDHWMFLFSPFLVPLQRAETTNTLLLLLLLLAFTGRRFWQGLIRAFGYFRSAPVPRLVPSLLTQLLVGAEAHSHHGLVNHPISTQGSNDSSGNRVSEAQHVSGCGCVHVHTYKTYTHFISEHK